MDENPTGGKAEPTRIERQVLIPHLDSGEDGPSDLSIGSRTGAVTVGSPAIGRRMLRFEHPR
jgi:hypothetical protein